jgi:ADP-ribose pyrophosphatase YjhB (NUDIX family)
MLSFHVAESRFQVRAAAVVLHEGFLLLHRAEPDEYWALPGGRVEVLESAAATVEREMVEELAEPVACGPLLFVVENFFTLGETPNHELGLYFSATLRTGSKLLSKDSSYAGVEGHTKLEFRWFPQTDLPRIDLRPAFLRESLGQPHPQFQHVVQRG